MHSGFAFSAGICFNPAETPRNEIAGAN